MMDKVIDFFKSLGPYSVYTEAFWELFISSIISTLPLWGLYISLSLNQQDIFELTRFYVLIHNGELFIYAATTLAPVLYIVNKERNNNSKFPGKFLFTSITVIIAAISALIIATQKDKAIALSQNWLEISLILYAISIVVLYFVLAINNRMLPDPAGLFRDSEDKYFEEYSKHRQ